MSNSPPIKTAMISSTALDLPDHRKQAMDACLREGVFPKAMEHLPARDADAIRVSLEMVDEADIYLGIYAWRYGHIPDGYDISITEMEFNRAVERKIPILIFLIQKDHTLTIEMVEADKGAQEKLKGLKERASQGRGRLEFQSPIELRSHIIQSLSALLKEEEVAEDEKRPPSLHPPNIIPTAPEPYIAHPYSLLQTTQVVGRQIELNLLTDWVTTNKQVPASVRLFNVVAIGGMGKSALTWKWFNDIAPHELPNRGGWMWWSFYESDAHYENFIVRALAYTSDKSEDVVRQLTQPDREDHLWRLLDEKPFVLVLDGLERMLLAYARMDASQMLDDDLDERTANRVARAIGLPESAGQSFIGKHQLRLTADQRAGQFLRRLARVRASRVLISTRLYPAELQAETGDPLPGCFAVFLPGLTDDDALNLWREFKVSGSREELLPVFRSFGNYPLLVRALAGEVAGYRPAPRDFDKWRAANPGFNPAHLDLKNAKTHVLEYALSGLGETQRQVLHTIAAFRMPATWDTLRALLVQSSGQAKPHLDADVANTEDSVAKKPSAAVETKKACADQRALDEVLTELEDRGLMGWDKQANRYDLHPIVRGVVWAALAPQVKQHLYRELHTYFDALPAIDASKIVTLEDLRPAIEIYHSLIGLQQFDGAYRILSDRLVNEMFFCLGNSRQFVELVEPLFLNGIEAPPSLEDSGDQCEAIALLALAYFKLGEPRRAVLLFRKSLEWFPLGEGGQSDFDRCSMTCDALLSSGELRETEGIVRRVILAARPAGKDDVESWLLFSAGLAFAICGRWNESNVVLNRALVSRAGTLNPWRALIQMNLAQMLLWRRRFSSARLIGELPFPEFQLFGPWEIRAIRIQGEAELALGELVTAQEHLHLALTRARAVNLIEEELPTLTALAEFHRQRQQLDLAREQLEQVWPSAERGPYPLLHADARNVLGRIERDEGHRDAAIAAATRAYELAWCDGPPYAYHFGLTNAKQLLAELGAPEPQLPPFDESKFEPMPNVDLNPKDEFWVDPATLEVALDDQANRKNDPRNFTN